MDGAGSPAKVKGVEPFVVDLKAATAAKYHTTDTAKALAQSHDHNRTFWYKAKDREPWTSAYSVILP